MKDVQPFTREDDARLRELHATGIPFSAIAAEMDRSKNSIVGRVHRLKLPPRPSPIKGGPRPQNNRLRMSLGGVNSGSSPAKAILGNTLAALGVVKKEEPPPPPVTFQRASQPCCWPIGEPKTPGFRYCDAPGVPGRSYCPEHEARAWQKPRFAQTEERGDWLESNRFAAIVARQHAQKRWSPFLIGHTAAPLIKSVVVTNEAPD